MTHRFAAVAAAGLLCWSLPAFAIGIGVEGGGTATFASGLGDGASSTAGSGNLGVIVDNSFGIAVIFFDLWADVQTPWKLQTGGPNLASIVPIDLGLRVGLGLGPIQPYVGVLGQMGIVTDSGSGTLQSPNWGLGGDLGLDIAVLFLKVGVELRGVEMLSNLTSAGAGPASGFALEGLGSVRLGF